jgi:hypothetical protein
VTGLNGRRAAKFAQRSGAVKRLFGCPVERLAGVLLADAADDDGHLADRTVRRRLRRAA